MQQLPYRGLRRKLVLAFDVGTTFSGISYCVLDPGQVPEVKGVTRFPAHEQVSGASKIPTILYYDQHGKAQAIGAEALRETVYELAEEKKWHKAEWFKLHIRPKDASTYKITSQIPPLPEGVDVIQVMADYIRYLFKCAANYIKDTHANGHDLWSSVEDDIEFVLSHPNGWEGYQQSQLRKSVVLAGLIPDTTSGHARISFVTEGEASLHFAVQNGLPKETMENGDGVVIVDAGGGTIDISTYRKPKYSKTFEEIAAPQCHFSGSIFVSIRARLFLESLLNESDYMEDLDHIVRCFDKTTKIRFSDDKQPQYIKFGSTRDNDPNCNIRFGQMKLSGEDVSSFFEPSIRSIVNTVQEQSKQVSHPITHVVLVGGFGSSDWLLQELQKAFTPMGLTTMRPELYVNKAVSDGAVSFYLSHMVTARIARYSYGTFQNIEYKSALPDHQARLDKLITRPSGRQLLPNSFKVMLSKGTKVSEETEVKVHLWKEVESISQLSTVTFDVYCYKGRLDDPQWKDMDASNFKNLCSVTVDLSHLPLEPQTKGEGGGTYFRVKYWVVLLFNSAELKAQMLWYEHGIEQRSPARLAFYQDK